MVTITQHIVLSRHGTGPASDDTAARFAPAQITALATEIRRPLELLLDPAAGRRGVQQFPAVYPKWLRNGEFCASYSTRFPYFADEASIGIATTETAENLSGAGRRGFSNASGLRAEVLREAVERLDRPLRSWGNWGPISCVRPTNSPWGRAPRCSSSWAPRRCERRRTWTPHRPSCCPRREDCTGRSGGVIRSRRVLAEMVVTGAVDTLDDGDAIYTVMRGAETISDGRGIAVYAPLPAGRVRALLRAYQAAGYLPDTVKLMEAHDTGTSVSDSAETTALRTVSFEASRYPVPLCALRSPESRSGHTNATAGAAGPLKAVLGLHPKLLPEVTRPDLRLRSSIACFRSTPSPGPGSEAHRTRSVRLCRGSASAAPTSTLPPKNAYSARTEARPPAGARRRRSWFWWRPPPRKLLGRRPDIAEDRRLLSVITRES